MKKFICRKPCKFSKKYIVGEEIPADEIAENRVPALIKYGIIAAEETPDEPVAPVEKSEEKAEKKPETKAAKSTGGKKAAK